MIDADILMITYNRPEYTELSLSRLLATCPPGCRVWLWHNGTDVRTIDIVKKHARHPVVVELNISEENQMLRNPTNWFWSNAKGTLLGKVDDDCLMPEGWVERLAAIHSDDARAGVLSCWPFLQDEYSERVAAWKTITLQGDHKLLHNLWVGGGGYLTKRKTVEQNGLLTDKDSFPAWCIRLAQKGWLNGWPVPLLLMDHMDHPRSPNTMIRSESDFHAKTPLTARTFRLKSYEQHCELTRELALEAQTASTNVWRHVGWTGRLFRIARNARRGIFRIKTVKQRMPS